MKITVIGCGRWGTFIAWYLDHIGHNVTLYGRNNSKNMNRLKESRSNSYLELAESIVLETNLSCAMESEIIIISIHSQGLRELLVQPEMLASTNRIFVLCMKGIEIATGKRLSEVASEYLNCTNSIAVWLGPGHVQDFYMGIPNCMVIDSAREETKSTLVSLFKSDLIRFYIGNDLLGNEIGAATKNVIGIAAGMLDALNLTSLKGALMSRATHEISQLIKVMGGSELSVYGLCHLGDYGATVFSEFSHNRRYGEAFAKGENFGDLAEGYYTATAINKLNNKFGVDLPICQSVYEILMEGANVNTSLRKLFLRSVKNEF